VAPEDDTCVITLSSVSIAARRVGAPSFGNTWAAAAGSLKLQLSEEVEHCSTVVGTSSAAAAAGAGAATTVWSSRLPFLSLSLAWADAGDFHSCHYTICIAVALHAEVWQKEYSLMQLRKQQKDLGAVFIGNVQLVTGARQCASATDIVAAGTLAPS